MLNLPGIVSRFKSFKASIHKEACYYNMLLQHAPEAKLPYLHIPTISNKKMLHNIIFSSSAPLYHNG